MIDKQRLDAPIDNEAETSGDTINNMESLYSELQKGIVDITLGNTRPFFDAMADAKRKRNKSL